uniref:LIM domain binding 2 n=1 Tax=Anas zonorhyncha TaxID=75864 RepID=A0A8B9U7C7_9AVES
MPDTLQLCVKAGCASRAFFSPFPPQVICRLPSQPSHFPKERTSPFCFSLHCQDFSLRRHTPYMVQPEYRIYEMNKRLQSRTEDSDNLWWDAFATEFFEDDATLTLSFCLEDGPKRYSIYLTSVTFSWRKNNNHFERAFWDYC